MEGKIQCNVPTDVFFLSLVVGASVVFDIDLIPVDGIFISTAISVEVLKYSFTDLKSVCCLEESLK